MRWERRRDLEGGKELGVWLLIDENETVKKELYVESHEYRGGEFDVYVAIPEGKWTHEGEFETRREAFEQALNYIESSRHPRDSSLE